MIGGDPKCIALAAAGLLAHSDKRADAMDRKAMIVRLSMSRRIYVDPLDALNKLQPEWEAQTLHQLRGRKNRITQAGPGYRATTSFVAYRTIKVLRPLRLWVVRS